MNPTNKKPLDQRTHYVWQAANPKLKKFVGNVIRQTRLARDQDVAEMARELGIADSTIYRWERGDIGGAPALMFWWLFKDHDGDNMSMDPLYWRQRAILAEDALSKMSEAIYDHHEERERMLGSAKTNGAGKHSPANRNGSQVPSQP
jgi:transcriptional regulator with XRE-family HTH domain